MRLLLVLALVAGVALASRGNWPMRRLRDDAQAAASGESQDGSSQNKTLHADGGDSKDSKYGSQDGKSGASSSDDKQGKSQSRDTTKKLPMGGSKSGGKQQKGGGDSSDDSSSAEEVQLTVVVFEVGKWPDYRQDINNSQFRSCVANQTKGKSMMSQQPKDDEEEDARIQALLPCLSQSKPLRPFVVLGHYLEAHGEDESQQSQDSLCHGDDDQLAAALDLVLDVFATAASPRNKFCDLWQHLFVPAYCALNTDCSPMLADQTLATAYALQQLAHNHSSPFSCKDSNGKELVMTTLNPQIYDADFKFVAGAKLLDNAPMCPKRVIDVDQPQPASSQASPAVRAEWHNIMRSDSSNRNDDRQSRSNWQRANWQRANWQRAAASGGKMRADWQRSSTSSQNKMIARIARSFVH